MTVSEPRPVTTAEDDERAPSGRIAVVGIACRYPDAENPEQLWQNVLAGRRAFRKLPDQRMRAEDYYSPDPAAPDRFYSAKAAVIEGFEFDRVRYRVAGSTFRSTDMTHWLALDTATAPWRTPASRSARGWRTSTPASSSATPSPGSSAGPI